jgi:AraC-like DNA-binding protein
LLEQVIDLDGEMGFAYERCCEYYKDFHTHDRLMLIFPRGSSSMEVRTTGPRASHKVDASSILLVPKDLNHDDEGTASIYDTMALYPTKRLVNAAARKLDLTPQNLDRLYSECLKVRRHPKLDQFVQDYFFLRVLSRRPDQDEDASYLSRRILEETLRLAFPSAKKETLAPDNQAIAEPAVTRAVRYIETNLFETLELDEIARVSGASVSTLLRRFRQELNLTPYAYIKNRRLEEAHRLLLAGDHGVGEVAVLVGYGNFGAFSDAFKAKFGVVPSALQKSKARS